MFYEWVHDEVLSFRRMFVLIFFFPDTRLTIINCELKYTVFTDEALALHWKKNVQSFM